MSSNQITGAVTTVTPEMANAWLQAAAPNRNISEKAVNKYARDMKNGKWYATNNGIAFNKQGQLIDGEHRLRAVVRAGVAIETVVVTHMDNEARRVIDCGVPRDIPGQWKIHGDFPELSGVLNTLASYARSMIAGPTPTKSPAFSYDELTGFVERKYDALRFTLDNLMSGNPKDRKGVSIAPVGGMVCRAWYHVDHDALAEFCYSLRTGLGVSTKQNSVMLLRDFLKSDAVSSAGGTNRADYYCRAQTALVAYADSKALQVLRPTRKDLFPVADALIA